MRFLVIRNTLWLIAFFACFHPAKGENRVWKVMAIGDSITPGGSISSNSRYPRWEKLTAAEYFIDDVGSRPASSRLSTPKHEGDSGQNVEYLAIRHRIVAGASAGGHLAAALCPGWAIHPMIPQSAPVPMRFYSGIRSSTTVPPAAPACPSACVAGNLIPIRHKVTLPGASP